MSDEREDRVRVMEAHQELVTHLERSSGRMRALSIVTVFVAVFFAFAYVGQLLLPLTGITTVTVDLTSASNVLTELIVLALSLAWLYVGARDYLFSTRIRKVVGKARLEERELEKRMPSGPSE